MRDAGRILTTTIAFLATLFARAAPEGFEPGLRGLLLGGGTTYYAPSTYENRFDPLPRWLDTDVTGSRKITFVPAKIGLFFTPAHRIEVQAYGRYILTLPSTWTTALGTGSTSYGSLGFGGNLHFFVLDGSRFRFGVSVNAEMVYHKVAFEFTHTDGTAELLNATALARLVGPGVVAQLWLGDLWSLELLALYQHGAEGNWTLVGGGDFAGTTKAAGILTDAAGERIVAEFGGFFAEVSLRLVF